jgi:hypothetical protein
LEVEVQPQDRALLEIWQLQRAAGIKPDDRKLPPLPANDQDSFERDLESIRQCMESKS